ncbi:MAG: rhomboid family intramembrane serine protease [Armatimonadetes bacterium]|nr:rhomboid family intramembrane serine protease [Armatimonadota bacterium]MBS1710691.1 rhomboid family intramembrane serine protease [Armatimonadota bacterium]MBX3108362.1 rhomboid family intramembrane serine protease [Fimbriimonadaceae bacterium]
MIPIRDNLVRKNPAVIVWTLIGLNVLIFLWDRNGGFSGPNIGFADLAMRPIQVVKAFSNRGDPIELAKIFTSLFLHGSLMHLVGNMLFLFAFGPAVEEAIRPPRFALYYIFWGLFAAAAHIFVNPASDVPTVGASGAIGGVLGAYFLLFPGSQIRVVIPPFFFWPFTVTSWMLLVVWFLWQVLFPQEGVANWAHVGGFLAGMVTVLVMGGRNAVLADSPIEEDAHFDEDD